MKKDFKKWHTKKELLHNEKDISNLFFKEREVWWVALGANIGFEQDGKGEEFRRPVLILKKFNQFVLLVVPLTTKIKNNKYYFPINIRDGTERMAIISQIRLIDTKRLIDKLARIDDDSFTKIKNAIKAML